MKIAIVSSYEWLKRRENYGTLLQNYALQSHLKKMGHESFWIKSLYSESTILQKIKCVLSNIVYFKRNRNLRKTEIEIKEFTSLNPRYFDTFMKKHMNLSENEYQEKYIKKNYPLADLYIVGSDQVWCKVNNLRFLNFNNKKNIKKIAYAVSRSWNNASERWIKEASKLIGNFDAVSVREFDGIDICKKAGYKTPKLVVDPTALLSKDEYMNLVSLENENKEFSTPFVLMYLINFRDKNEIGFSKIEKAFIDEKLSIKIVPLQGTEFANFPNEYIQIPTPTQWLNMYDKADVIFTNSFHGTMFSIIFRKNFIVLLQSGLTCGENCRFNSLLNYLGLTNRMLTINEITSNPNCINDKIKEEIDWESVENKLSKFISDSKDFLENALKQ